MRRKKRTFEERLADFKAKNLAEENRKLAKLAKQLISPSTDRKEDAPTEEESQEAKQQRRSALEKLLSSDTRKILKIRTVVWTPAEDQKLRDIYEKYATENMAWKVAATAFPKKTESAVFRRAIELRLTRTRERYRWDDDELSVLEAFAHQSPEAIQRKLIGISPPGVTRTRSAIIAQIHALRFRSNLPGLSKKVLAEALGVSTYLIDEWREGGLLRGSVLPSLSEAKDKEPVSSLHFYHNWHIWTFLLNNPGFDRSSPC